MGLETCRGINEPAYYHREYNNDLPRVSEESSWVDTSKRVVCVALPFISLYKPLSFPLSVGMGAFRVYTSVSQLVGTIQTSDNAKEIALEVSQTAISVIALVGTIFAHPIGMLITTGQDLILETIALVQHLQNGDLQKVFESCISIINNALYLMLFLNGGLELAIASLAVQILTGLYHSISEFKEGKYLEAGGHLLMAVVRSHQVVEKIRVLRLTHEIDMLIKFGNNPDGLSALDYACKTGDEKAVQFLLDRGASAQGSPIFYAAIGGNAKVIGLLIKHGAEVNPKTAPMTHNYSSKKCCPFPSPLHLAALFNHGEAISCLLHYMADPSITYWDRIFLNYEYRDLIGTPVHTAAINGNIEAIEAFIAAGVSLEMKEGIHSANTPLFTTFARAYSENKNNVIELLLKNGVDIKNSSSPIIFYADETNMELVIKYGAEVDAANFEGRTKLKYLIESCYQSTDTVYRLKINKQIHILLEHGAKVTEDMIQSTKDAELQNLLRSHVNN